MQVIHVNPHLGHLNNETGKEKHKPGNTLLSKMQLYAADLDMVSTYFGHIMYLIYAWARLCQFNWSDEMKSMQIAF